MAGSEQAGGEEGHVIQFHDRRARRFVETSTSRSPYPGRDHDGGHEATLFVPLASVAGSVCISVSPRKVVFSQFADVYDVALTRSVGKKCVKRDFVREVSHRT